ncbi:maker190, partial [Drosophila busckii]
MVANFFIIYNYLIRSFGLEPYLPPPDTNLVADATYFGFDEPLLYETPVHEDNLGTNYIYPTPSSPAAEFNLLGGGGGFVDSSTNRTTIWDVVPATTRAPRNCHIIKCPKYLHATFATDGVKCLEFDNECFMAVASCKRYNEKLPLKSCVMSKDELVHFFELCWRRKFVNVLITFKRQLADELYSYTPFPKLQLLNVTNLGVNYKWQPLDVSDVRGFEFRIPANQLLPLGFNNLRIILIVKSSIVTEQEIKDLFKLCWQRKFVNILLTFQRISNNNVVQHELFTYNPFPKVSDVQGFAFKVPVFQDPPMAFY